MNVEERVAYERRVGLRQAAIAALAGILLVAAVAVQLGGAHAKVDEQTLGLITENKRLTRDIVGSVLDALGYFSLAATLWYLWSCIRARNPEVKPGFVGILGVVGGVVTGISIPAYVILYGGKAHDFVGLAAQTYPQANHLISSTVLVFPQLGNYLGVLLTAMATVLVSLNAMRVGLLTRFMGFLGIFAGVLVIFPLVPIPIVEGFWLVALAYLFTGRWPNGVPPAWRSGQAEPCRPRRRCVRNAPRVGVAVAVVPVAAGDFSAAADFSAAGVRSRPPLLRRNRSAHPRRRGRDQTRQSASASAAPRWFGGVYSAALNCHFDSVFKVLSVTSPWTSLACSLVCGALPPPMSTSRLSGAEGIVREIPGVQTTGRLYATRSAFTKAS